MREQWFIDGFQLTDGRARDIESRDGLYGTNGLVGENTKVAGRRGAVWRPKVFDEASLTLTGWAGGETDRSEFEDLWDELVSVIARSERTLLLQHVNARGDTRVASGEVVAAVAPRPVGSLAARFDIGVNIPDGVWRSDADVTSSHYSPGTGDTFTLTPFAGSTAPLDEHRLVFTGPVNDPGLSCPGAPPYVIYHGSVAAGQSLTIDCSTWTVSGSGGMSPTGDRVESGGYDSFLSIPHGVQLAAPTVTFTGTGTTSASRVDVIGRRMYRTC